MNVVWNCVKYTMKVAAVCLSTTHAKSAMGLSWKWRHRVIRVIIWRPRPRPHQPSLCIARSCRLLVIYLKKKQKKQLSKSWYVTMCIANKLKKNNKYVFISCRPQKTSVLGHKSGLKRDDRPSNHHADARSPGQPTPPFIPETLSVRGRDIIAALSNDRLVSKHWKKTV